MNDRNFEDMKRTMGEIYFYSIKLCIYGHWPMCSPHRLVGFPFYTSCVLRGALHFQRDWCITYIYIGNFV